MDFRQCGICGGKGIRTPDLLIANETLYQLSYTPGKSQTISRAKNISATTARLQLDDPPAKRDGYEI